MSIISIEVVVYGFWLSASNGRIPEHFGAWRRKSWLFFYLKTGYQLNWHMFYILSLDNAETQSRIPMKPVALLAESSQLDSCHAPGQLWDF